MKNSLNEKLHFQREMWVPEKWLKKSLKIKELSPSKGNDTP